MIFVVDAGAARQAVAGGLLRCPEECPVAARPGCGRAGHAARPAAARMSCSPPPVVLPGRGEPPDAFVEDVGGTGV
jgi:hypothetical protein